MSEKRQVSVRVINELWAALFAFIVIAYLLTHQLGSNKQLLDYLNFALALTSLSLAFVSIVITLLGNTTLSSTLAQFQGVSEVIRDVAGKLEAIPRAVQDGLTGIQSQIAGYHQSIVGMAAANTSSTPMSSLPEYISRQEFLESFVAYTSPNGLHILLFAKIIERKKAAYDIISVLNASTIDDAYIYGFIVACQSAGLFTAEFSGRLMRVDEFPGLTIDRIKQEISGRVELQEKDPRYPNEPGAENVNIVLLRKLEKFREDING